MRLFKKAGPPKPPPDAHHWMAWKFAEIPGVAVDQRRIKRTKMVSPPREDGTIPDSWPIAEFSPKALLEAWGDGKYQIEWYQEDGKRIGKTTYDVAFPAPAGPRLRQRRTGPAVEPEAEISAEASPLERLRTKGGATMSIMDYLILQREDAKAAADREERLAARHREEAAAAQQRDREFMGAIIATLKQPTSAGAPDADLLRREMALAIREGLHTIRKDVSEQLAQIPTEDPDDDEDGAPPKDLDEAAERIGQQLLGKLENVTPEVVEKLIPRVNEWLTRKFPTARGPRANGN
jgi:hypothetical protein